MLTGDLPFDCDNPLDLFNAIRDEPVPIPAEWPELQKDMVRRMLEKDPEKRITIDEMRVRASSCSLTASVRANSTPLSFDRAQDHAFFDGVPIPTKDDNLSDDRMVGEPSPEELRGAIRSISSAL